MAVYFICIIITFIICKIDEIGHERDLGRSVLIELRSFTSKMKEIKISNH